MKYKIFVPKEKRYFANSTFDSLADCHKQLVSYADLDDLDFRGHTLISIAKILGYEIHDLQGNNIYDAKTIENNIERTQ
jgi:hypothetical protein